MKNKKQLLELALDIATFAHKGQTTRDGGEYILHPMTVADLVDPLHIHSKLRMIALLHDVIEDTDWDANDLLNSGLPHEVVAAVVALTKYKGQSYEAYLEGVKKNYLSCLVKIADNTHNMDLTRLPEVRPKDILNLQKYRKSREMLKAHVESM